MGGVCGCCCAADKGSGVSAQATGTFGDARWSASEDEVNPQMDKEWLVLVRDEYQKVPKSQKIDEVIDAFCKHFKFPQEAGEVLRSGRSRHGVGCAALKQGHVDDPKLQAVWSPNFEEHYLCIYSWTINLLYKQANTVMNGADRIDRSGGAVGVSNDVKAVIPWYRKVECALDALPSDFDYKGTVYRVIPFAFADFETRFTEGKVFVWHSFRSTSRSEDILTNPCFSSGHSTVFEIQGARGKDITTLSQYAQECEILLPMGTTLRVKKVQRRSGQEEDGVRKSADWIVAEMLPELFSNLK